MSVQYGKSKNNLAIRRKCTLSYISAQLSLFYLYYLAFVSVNKGCDKSWARVFVFPPKLGNLTRDTHFFWLHSQEHSIRLLAITMQIMDREACQDLVFFYKWHQAIAISKWPMLAKLFLIFSIRKACCKGHHVYVPALTAICSIIK